MSREHPIEFSAEHPGRVALKDYLKINPNVSIGDLVSAGSIFEPMRLSKHAQEYFK
jgi:hypothetical protein